ncbi:MAG: hypothetical protein AADX96_13335, partial [Thiocapsa sp. C3-sup]
QDASRRLHAGPATTGVQGAEARHENGMKVLMGKPGRLNILVTGYSLGHPAPTSFENTGFLLTATRIDKIYAHDDQVGPFSRMEIDGKEIQLENRLVPSILTSWRGADGVIGNGRAISDIVLIPIYHKIRIPFGAIHDLVLSFDQLLKQVIAAIAPALFPDTHQFEWDIYLSSVNDLKKEILKSGLETEASRIELLLQSLPRFLWRASLITSSSTKIDLIFDATDIEQGAYFVRAIEHDSNFADNLRLLFGLDGIRENFESSPAWQIIEWFRRER